ncbi:MAG TPA: transcription elongation factor Spt5 [Methanospirillum sp.]|jgi:transcriptional antiterminator NusG|uniref:transcription elongation factor Spt5 n=1 Tax=Methanospirillum sp. TaxID=45200 RepID=UPI0009CD7E4F|nr:transcription elongation factor Spt5 [Methanospirillum sp.]OQB39164.1 MAG: Transcription elongation factor Spt5 [Euryarchaeota archaeon ADurb.Bin165]HPY60146.1 transcription elongation factor Spt5 [Methanospirillum sp.]
MENEHRLTRIFAVKTTNRAERSVADNIDKAVRDANNDIRVMSVIVPDELKGYVLIETDEPFARVQELMEHVPSARTVLPGVTSLEEVGHYLVPKPAVSGIDEGTIVELINGPFKGEKAVVKRVDASKEEITVELYESVLPIPITVRGDHVRVIDRREDDS